MPIELSPDAARALVEELYAALGAGDADTITALLADDFVGRVTPGLPFGIGGTHEGPAAMIRDCWFTIGAHWRVRPVPERWSVLDDGRLQVEGTYRGKGRRSGRPFEAAYVHVFELRDGLIAGLVQVADSAAFLEALGDELPLRTIDLSARDGVAVLRLNRAERRNAIDQELADELLVAAQRVSRDASVRALLICGAGPDLSVGGDIGYFTESTGDDLGTTMREMTVPFHLAFQVLASLDVPIVTVAHGAVAGGALGFVYAGDVVVAAEDARFVTAFAAIGLSGDGGGTWHLPRRIGPVRAAWAYLANEPISARQALEWGLVTELSADAHARGAEIARRLADGPTRAFGRMRGLLRQSWDRSLPEQLSAEIEALVATARTNDASGAIAAFAAKDRPTFQGD